MVKWARCFYALLIPSHPSAFSPSTTLLFMSLLRLTSSFRRLSTSPKVLLAFLEALCYVFIAFLFNNCIDRPLTINPLFNSINDGSHCSLPKIFSFDFFQNQIYTLREAISTHAPLTLFLGVAAFVRRLNHRHPTSTRRSVSNTRLRMDLTRRRMLSTHRPLQCCISGVASPPHPPPSPAYFHQLMLLSSLFWVLYFEFLFLFSVFFRAPSAICNYLIYMV
jgi:hypothetical protein